MVAQETARYKREKCDREAFRLGVLPCDVIAEAHEGIREECGDGQAARLDQVSSEVRQRKAKVGSGFVFPSEARGGKSSRQKCE